VRGGGARLNGDPIAVSGATDLASALVGTGFGYSAPIDTAHTGWR
jgi:myo-inositol-1(or 4)-monophosphatase